MVQLETLLPILLENDTDHGQTETTLNVQDFIDELNNHGIYNDVDLLFAPASIALSIDPALLQELRDKIANFLSAEGSSADDVYLQDQANLQDRPVSKPCRTGVEAVNKLLGGGWSGEVVELLGDKGTGKTWLALHTVLKHLHENPNENALWLDTTGSFSAEWASKITQSVAKQSPKPAAVNPSMDASGVLDAAVPGQDDTDSTPQAPSALDRLIVAKVFELQSAIQAIQQVRNQRQSQNEADPKREESKVPNSEVDEQMADSEATIYSDVVPETGMPAGDDLLQSSPGQVEQHQEKGPDEKEFPRAPHLRFIVIDSISALLKGVLSATSAEGHARMMSFMRLLRSLTSTSSPTGSKQFTTIFVINNLVSLASTANSTAALHSVFPALNAKKVKAALGPTFTYLTDWTIYLSHTNEVFRTSTSAENGASAEGGSVILEIIRSRRMPQGRWAILPLNS